MKLFKKKQPKQSEDKIFVVNLMNFVINWIPQHHLSKVKEITISREIYDMYYREVFLDYYDTEGPVKFHDYTLIPNDEYSTYKFSYRVTIYPSPLPIKFTMESNWQNHR